MKARSKSDRNKGDTQDDLNSEPLVEPPAEAPQSESGEASSATSGSGHDALLKLKIAPKADVASTLERLNKTVGLRDIEQLFPGETHPDLSNIYTAHVDAERMTDVIPEVAADEDVEYVDGPAPRGLA